MPSLSDTPSGYVAPREAPTTARDRLAYLQRRGWAFEVLPGGKLLAGAPSGRASRQELDDVARCAWLFAGILAGTPVRCEHRHRGEAPGP